MPTVNYKAEKLRALCRDAFMKMGFNEPDADTITDVLLLADLYGVKSHGTQRLIRYHKSVEKGCVKVDARPETVFETPVSAVIDGHSGMGQLISVHAMKLAIEKARKMGMAFVTVRNSNHFGIAGYYTKMASDAGLFGIATTNSESIMVHTGSRQAVLGSNPIAVAMPAEPYPFWFDAATTVVPKGKLEVYNKAEKPLRDGWALDRQGRECYEPQEVLECIDGHLGVGGILPVGGKDEADGSHKGYGYSMICEIFSSIFSCGSTSNHHVRIPGQGAGTCHGFIVIDPALFGDPEEIKKNFSVFLSELRGAKRVDEEAPIYTHGEKEYYSYKRLMEEGIEVDISTVAEMQKICRDLGLDSKAYLGDVDTTGAKESIYDRAYSDK